MAYVALSRSPIHVREVQGPVDPGFGRPGFGFGGERPDQGLPGGGGHPDQGLPGGGGHPSHGLPGSGPVDPGFGIELPPVISTPPFPGTGLPEPPTYPVRPGNSLPRPPHAWPLPPRPENPDPGYDRPIPIYPSVPIYEIPPEVDNSLPMEPGTVWPPLPDEVTGKVVAFVWIVGVGYRWTVIDTDLKPTVPIAPQPIYPDQGLPETPAPKE
jgi:hypothetical protein